MTAELPAWPRGTTYIHVTPAHVKAGKPASLTESAAALAVSEAIGAGVATVSVNVDLIMAHEKRAPGRWWVAETPEEVGEWTADLDSGAGNSAHLEAAELGLLDFSLTWREGNQEAATTREDDR